MTDSPPRSTSESSSLAQTESSWREWSQRENGQEGYKFGDFSRGVFHQMKVGVRDLKHRVADTALTLKETHEQRAVDYVRELAATDEGMQDVVQHAMDGKASTSAERFWTQLCKDAHTDHEEHMDEIDCSESSGVLQVEVIQLGTEEHPLLRPDRKRAEKAVLLACLGERRSKSLKEEKVAMFQVYELLGADLVIYTFDRASPKFGIGMEDGAFCGGCVLPLCAILQPDRDNGLPPALRSSFSQERFGLRVVLQLLPLQLMRARRKLQPGEQTGVKMPQDLLGHIILKLTLSLKQSPAKLFLMPTTGSEPIPQTTGHVSDPFSVIKACGMAVARLQSALKMELWKAALHEMRENFLLMIWWSILMLLAPLWTWPFLFNFFLGIFAWTVNRCHQRSYSRRLYINEGDDKKEEPSDVVKEAVKASLHIMQFTENLNKAASQIEKMTFALCLEDRCLSSICLMLCFSFALPASIGILLLQWMFRTGYLRYLFWFPGSFVTLPEAIREVLFQGLQHVDQMKKDVLGEDLERRLMGFWQRVPDETEASHLYLFKHYVFRGRRTHESL